VAPSLSNVIRSVLQGKKISSEGVETHLKNLGNLQRYDSAFNWLWFALQEEGKIPMGASLEDVVDVLLKLNESLPNQARNAFAACLLVPGFEGLRFRPLMLKCRKQWNQSTPRYPKFWNGARVIKIIGCGKYLLGKCGASERYTYSGKSVNWAA